MQNQSDPRQWTGEEDGLLLELLHCGSKKLGWKTLAVSMNEQAQVRGIKQREYTASNTRNRYNIALRHDQSDVTSDSSQLQPVTSEPEPEPAISDSFQWTDAEDGLLLELLHFTHPGGRSQQKLNWEELAAQMSVQAKARGIKQREYNHSKAYYRYFNFIKPRILGNGCQEEQ
jgi:hypothetical protein